MAEDCPILIDPTPSMIEAGVFAFEARVPIDVARPLSSSEEIVESIYRAMVLAICDAAPKPSVDQHVEAVKG